MTTTRKELRELEGRQVSLALVDGDAVGLHQSGGRLHPDVSNRRGLGVRGRDVRSRGSSSRLITLSVRGFVGERRS